MLNRTKAILYQIFDRFRMYYRIGYIKGGEMIERRREKKCR